MLILIFLSANLAMIAASSITPMIEYFYPDKVQADVNEPIDFQFSANDVWRADISVFYIEFHDGSLPVELTPEKINITHAFQNEGKYLITLTAVAISGLTDVKTCEIEIINAPPIFDLDLPNTAFEDEKISASVINLIDSAQDCENAKYHWNFGDGTFLTTKNINKTWSNEGIYPVTVTVFDDQGAIDTKTEFIEIINVAPVADFVIESLKSDCPYIINIDENEVVVYEACPLYFNASFSYDTLSDLNGTLYYWDFDDGQIGTGIGVIHQFMQSGNYTVTLRVKDDNGDIGITQKIVQVVNEAPWIELLTKSIILKEGETFIFETDSSDSLPDYPFLNYAWDFGDYGWRASNLWLDDFTGDVSVNVTDLEGLSDTDYTSVVVENVPPNINLNWAYVDMNITISIKAPTPKPCNFSIEFLENDETIGVYIVRKSSGDNRVETPPLPFFMDLSRNYTIKVNRTHVLEPGTYFVYLEFSFLDGNSFTISSSFNEHWPGWKVSPNEWILNPENYIFDMPITLGGSIFDPSIDDIHLDIDFKTHLLLEIDFPGSAEFVYPYRTTITLPHDPNHIIYDAYVYNESGKIYSDLTFSQNLASIDYIDNEFPTTIPIDATAYPIDLSFLDMHKKINIDGAFVIDVIEAVNTFDVYVSDDDGGEDSKSVKIDTTKGTAKVINLAPDIYIYTLNNSTEDSVVPMRVDVFDFENDTVSVQWDFGDGSPPEIDPLDGSDIHHVYENEGTYLITVTATDGKMITKMGRVIQIFNKPPELKIELNPNIVESQLVKLNNTYIYDDSASDKETLRFYWDFGDGSNYYQLEFDPFWCSQCSNQQVELAHSWAEQGFYNLTLYIIDDNGDIGSVTIVMNVTNVAPFIEGPYGFENIEGRVINLDVAVFDSFQDELDLSYTWEIDGQTLYGKKPTVYLDDGNYTANLIVTDNDGETSNAEIDLIIEDIRPEVLITSKSIYGAPGEIKLTAYSLDTFLDVDTLYYIWSFNSTTLFEHYGDISSSVFYEYTDSSTITGLVEVFDDTGKRGMDTFQLFIIMDSDGDGLTDEYEVQIGSSPDDSDSDSDFITDWYEENIYGTDPLNADTDNDGLPDGYGMVTPNIFGGELWLGTNPLLNDTDGDNLTDGFEFIGWSLTTEYYPEGPDEDPESITYWVTSNPLLLDTDGDKVSDWEEYTHGTDPMNKDTDNDGIDDLEDLFPWKVDGDDDGLSDSKEREIGTDPNKADTDDDGLSDGEEYYPGQDGYITDPLNNDTDNDFLLDGQELYSTSKKIDKRIKINAGLNTFILYSERSERIASASLTLSISVGEGAQTTDLTIKLVMQGFTLFEKYAGNQRYFANVTDIKELIEKRGRTFGGQWILEVHSTIECLLEEYEIDFTKYLNPNNNDTDNDGIKDGVEINPELNNGWITNPAKKDTDGDTINDGFEISMGWNPLSKDTDGDGVEDWKDVDPLHNLIVMVKVNQGHYDSWEQILTPLLQVTLEVEADPEHKWEVATPSSWASTGSKDINAWIPWLCEHCYDISWTLYWLECWWKKVCTNTWLGKICWYELRCAWRSKTFYSTICVWLPCLKEITLYTIQTTANFGQEYYFDVDDGDKDMTVKAELWKNYIVGWLPHVEGKITHNLMKSGYQMNVQKNKKIYSGSNWVSLDIETKGIPRVNTIAVYENGTFYKGHYSEIDRMNVVILNVISGTNQYFDSGINVILIPTPVFTNTKLHGIIETSVNENGQVSDSSWADVPACIKGAKIAGINRDDYKDTISPNVECVITKNVSADDAYDILLLAITSANESEGIIFLFTSDYIAEELGIAADVLELIPLDIIGFINSEVGEWPRTPWENFVQLIKDIIQFVIDVLVAIGQFFIALFEWIADVGMNLVEAVAQAVLAVVEAILKAIVLVFIWLMFVITLLIFYILMVSLTAYFLALSIFLPVEITLSLTELKVTGIQPLRLWYIIGQKNIDFLDLTIPTLEVNFETPDISIKFVLAFLDTEFNINTFPTDVFGGINPDTQITETSTLNKLFSGTSALLDDTTGPTISNIVATPNPIELGSNLLISCEATDSSGILGIIAYIQEPDGNNIEMINLFDDGTNGDLISGDGVFSSQLSTSNLNLTTHYIDIEATDNSPFQNVNYVDNGCNFQVEDTIGADITDLIVTDLNGGDALPGDTFRIEVVAFDLSGIYSAQISIEIPDETNLITLDLYNDGTNGDQISDDNVYTCQWTTDVNTNIEGNHYLDVYALDNSPSQNPTSINNMRIINLIDITAPTISNIQIDPSATGVYHPGQLFNITARVIDTGLGISKVEVEIETPDGTVIDTFELYDDGAHNDGNAGDNIYGNIWDTSNIAEGIYYIDIKAIDSSVASNEVIVDNEFTIEFEELPTLLENFGYFLIGFGSALSVSGAIVAITAGLIGFCKEEKWKQVIFIAGLVVFIASTIVQIRILTLTWESVSPWELIGMGCGYLTMALVLFKLTSYMLAHWPFMAEWIVGQESIFIVGLGLVDFVLSIIDFSMNIDELLNLLLNPQSEEEENLIFDATWSMTTGALSLWLAVNAIIWLEGKVYKNRTDKAKISSFFGCLSIVFAIMFLGLGINKLLN